MNAVPGCAPLRIATRNIHKGFPQIQSPHDDASTHTG